jgi:aminoacyl tRNA synthase complex-interacting multifunctional protein 1
MEDLMILWWIGQVVAGLKKFVHEYELERRKVCVILNLKPAKLAGQVSEAMILAGSVPTPDGSEIVKVQSYPYPCPLIRHLILFV